MNGILIFGDSITSGRGITKNKCWVGRISKMYDEKDKNNYIVYNLGIPGESTTELIRRFRRECQPRLHRQHPDDSFILIINIGLNDSKHINSSKLPKTSIYTFEKNINKLIDTGKQLTKKIFFVGLTPINEKKAILATGNYFLNKNIETYNRVIYKCCKKKNIHFVDLFNNWFNQNYQKFLNNDGLHLNEIGHQNIFKKVIKYLNRI
ncbi:MAG: GDSL-type esterase/lipase family protein [Candidatus Pacebacteria bacterium]|nr:GDSL-type esterase/lipase family protein [Candidatus Paceibacterota bacterium]